MKNVAQARRIKEVRITLTDGMTFTADAGQILSVSIDTPWGADDETIVELRLAVPGFIVRADYDADAEIVVPAQLSEPPKSESV